jgi:hypothetical protein
MRWFTIFAAASVGLLAANDLQAGAIPPRRSVDVVNPRATDVFHVTFRGGETAIVGVSGDGDTDLDLYIYDEDGHLVASDTDLSDDCLATWTPVWTGVFRIEVRNLGSNYNRYVIATN